MIELAIFILILVLALLGLTYFIIQLFALDLSTNVKDKALFLKDNFVQVMGENVDEQLLIHGDHSGYFQRIVDKINESLMSLYLSATIQMSVFAIILIFLTAFWFCVDTKSGFVCILSFLFGCTVCSVTAFFCLKLSICANAQVIIKTNVKKESGIQFPFFTGTTIATGAISLCLLVLSILVMSARNGWIASGNMTVQLYENMFQAISGFALGFCFAAIFYRDLLGNLGRGLLIGQEIIGKIHVISDEDRIVSESLQMSNIVGSIITNNLVQVLDSIGIICMVLCALFIIGSNSDRFTKDYVGGFYSPMLLVAIMMAVSVGLSFLILGPEIEEDDEIVSMTAKKVRMQILLTNLIALLMYLVWPRYIFPNVMIIGQNDPKHAGFFFNGLSRGDGIVCLFFGQVFQGFLICFGEYLVSHWFRPTRNVFENNKLGSSFGLMTSQGFSSICQFLLFIILGIILIICFGIAGFYGIGLCAIGLFAIPVTIISINYLSGISNDSLQLAKVSRVYGQLIDNIFRVLWAAKNYSIYIQVINAGGIFLANLTCVGAILVLSKLDFVQMWNGFTLFGFFFGSSLAYFLRGNAILSSRNVALEIIKEEQETRERINEEQELNLNQDSKFKDFISSKQSISFMKTLMDIILCVISIIFLGVLFGQQTLIGFIIGLNIVGIHIVFTSIIVGNQLKAAKHYSEHIKDEDKEADQKTNQFESHRQNLCTALGVEGSPGTSLIMFLAFNTLLVLLGSVTFSKMGFFRTWIEYSNSFVPEYSTHWIGGGLQHLDGGVKSKFSQNGEDGEINDEDVLPQIIKSDGEGASTEAAAASGDAAAASGDAAAAAGDAAAAAAGEGAAAAPAFFFY